MNVSDLAEIAQASVVFEVNYDFWWKESGIKQV